MWKVAKKLVKSDMRRVFSKKNIPNLDERNEKKLEIDMWVGMGLFFYAVNEDVYEEFTTKEVHGEVQLCLQRFYTRGVSNQFNELLTWFVNNVFDLMEEGDLTPLETIVYFEDAFRGVYCLDMFVSMFYENQRRGRLISFKHMKRLTKTVLFADEYANEYLYGILTGVSAEFGDIESFDIYYYVPDMIFTSRNGSTPPIFSAVINRDVELLELIRQQPLLDNYISSKQTHAGKTLMELAEESGDEKIIVIIRELLAAAGNVAQ